jgi:Phage tail lysozyme
MTDTKLFRDKAPDVIKKLIKSFDLTDIQAAGILGNLGHECAGFHILHEIGQPEGKGGYGWGQWTGVRRKQFLEWSKKKKLNWESDEANYGFLEHELETSESDAISALYKTASLNAAVVAFERNYERAGVPSIESREMWAQVALDAYRQS